MDLTATAALSNYCYCGINDVMSKYSAKQDGKHEVRIYEFKI